MDSNGRIEIGSVEPTPPGDFEPQLSFAGEFKATELPTQGETLRACLAGLIH